MIFLLREASEETCTVKNPYEEENLKNHKEFTKKYGILGEKLLSLRIFILTGQKDFIHRVAFPNIKKQPSFI